MGLNPSIYPLRECAFQLTHYADSSVAGRDCTVFNGAARIADQRTFRLQQPLNGQSQPGVQLVRLAWRHPLGLDRLANTHRELSRIQVARVNRKQIVDPGERNWHQRYLRANGQVRRAGKEWLQ